MKPTKRLSHWRITWNPLCGCQLFSFHKGNVCLNSGARRTIYSTFSDDIKELCLNPSMWENFDEESWLGKFKRIGLKCHGGTCTSKIFMRYLLYLTVQLREFNKTANLNEWLEGFVLECMFSHDFSKVINETWYRNGRSFCCGGPFGDKPHLRIGTTCEVKNVFSSHRLPSLQGLMGMLNETSSAV